MSCLKKNLKIP